MFDFALPSMVNLPARRFFAYLLKYPRCSVWFLLLLGPCDLVSKAFLSCSSPARADSEVGALAPVHGIRGPGATAAVASFLTIAGGLCFVQE